jgi:dTDP-4-amino-4,6-dideoxygalactose transaminase
LVKIIPRTAIPIGNREVVALSDRLLTSEDINEQDVAQFENEFASYLGARSVYAFNSGRTALYTALQALELNPETEVIVPAYTCAIVFEVILRLGLKPILIDVNPETYNINPDLIPRAITSKTRVIIPVHLFGQPCEMDKIMEIAKKHDLYIIEDVAQALGARHNNVKVGKLSDLAIFSFGPGKSITSGEGGALSVNNADFTEKIAELQARLKAPDLNWNLTLMRNILAMKMFSKQYLYGAVRSRLEDSLAKGDQEIVENCIKLTQKGRSTSVHPTIRLAKMPSVSAVIASMQLKKLDIFNAKRVRNADELSKLLHCMTDLIQLPKIGHDVGSTFTRYTIKLLKQPREPLMARLLMKGIDTERPYDYLPHLFKSLKIDAPKAEELAKSSLTLPNHPLVRTQDITKIANTLSNELNPQPKESELEEL